MAMMNAFKGFAATPATNMSKPAAVKDSKFTPARAQTPMNVGQPKSNPRTSQLQMAYKSNGLQGAMNLVKTNKRTSNVSMMASGFASNGAPIGRRTNWYDEDP
jgi:hypothetical protein